MIGQAVASSEAKDRAGSSEPSVKASRLPGPDLLKGAAIFGVAYIHAGGLAGKSPGIDLIANVFRFGVPVFVLIWAYFAERSYARSSSYLSWLFGVLKRIGLVFAFWSLVYLAVTYGPESRNVRSLVTRHFIGFGWSGQYLLLLVAQLSVLFPLCRWLAARAWRVAATVAVTLALYAGVEQGLRFSFHPLNIYFVFPYWIGYAVVGIAIARTAWRPSGWLAIVALAMLVVGYLLAPEAYGANSIPYAHPLLFVSSVLLVWSRIDLGSPVAAPIAGPRWMGRNSMGLFVLNPLGVLILARVGSPTVPSAWAVPMSFVYAGLVLAFAALVTAAFKRVGAGKLVS